MPQPQPLQVSVRGKTSRSSRRSHKDDSSVHCDETKTMCCVPLQQADVVVVGSIITKQEHNASTMMLDSLSTPILKP